MGSHRALWPLPGTTCGPDRHRSLDYFLPLFSRQFLSTIVELGHLKLDLDRFGFKSSIDAVHVPLMVRLDVPLDLLVM